MSISIVNRAENKILPNQKSQFFVIQNFLGKLYVVGMYIWKPVKNNYLFEFQAWPEKELPIVKVYTQEVASLENIIVGEHGRKNSRSSSKKCLLPSLGSWWSDLSTSRTPILLRLFYGSQFLPINFHNSGHIFKPPFTTTAAAYEHHFRTAVGGGWSIVTRIQ